MKFVKNCICLYYAREKLPFSRQKWHSFHVQYNYPVQNLETSCGYIFCILQHFASKLCSFTNFKIMSFLDMVKDLPRPKFSLLSKLSIGSHFSHDIACHCTVFTHIFPLRCIALRHFVHTLPIEIENGSKL